MNAALVLQLLLLLGVLYAKEKFMPNLVLLTTKKKKRAIGDGGARVEEKESAAQAKAKTKQQQQSSSSTTTTTSRSSVQQAVAGAAVASFMMTRRIIEQDLQKVNQKLDRISNDIHAQYKEINQKMHTLDVDLQQQGVFIHTNVDDSDEINVSTSPLLAKLDERFQEWMERLEAISKQVTKTGSGNDEIETKGIMQNVTLELASSLEQKMNQVSQNVRALSLGFVAAVTIALATVALPRVVDVTRGLLATFDDE